MSAPVLIDLQAIENLRELNPDDNDAFVREIVGIYLEDTPLRIAELEASLAAGDGPRFSRTAHSIKGSSANLGAAALRSLAEQLEQRSHRDGLGNVAGLLADLKQEYVRTQAEFGRMFPA